MADVAEDGTVNAGEDILKGEYFPREDTAIFHTGISSLEISRIRTSVGRMLASMNVLK